MRRPLLIRWTVGDVHSSGFEALRLSVWGAHRLFGHRASCVICVNTIGIDDARRSTGELPPGVSWRRVTRDDVAPFIRCHLDGHFAEGAAWKFAPVRVATDRAELALDNDCILWDVPDALRRWAEGGDRAVVAEDVRACFGRFTPLCGAEPRNLGIRALPRNYNLASRMRAVLARVPATMTSELDEQGLQMAALSLDGVEPKVVRIDEVSICSPFPPHLPHLGSCGAHFVGVNARSLPWTFEGRPGVAHLQDHWNHWRAEVARLVGARLTPS